MRTPRHPLGFEECRTARQPAPHALSCGAASAQGKGAPGDGDALPLLFDRRSAQRLLGNRAARDPVPGVPGGVGLHVVGLRMNHFLPFDLRRWLMFAA